MACCMTIRYWLLDLIFALTIASTIALTIDRSSGGGERGVPFLTLTRHLPVVSHVRGILFPLPLTRAPPLSFACFLTHTHTGDCTTAADEPV